MKTLICLLLFLLPLTLLAKPTAIDLNTLYADYNKVYFSGKLPQQTISEFGVLDESLLGKVSKEDGGRFRITLNLELREIPKLAHMTLLHEQCHIATWDEQPMNMHGKRWFSCMHHLVAQGAFEELW